MKQKNYVAGNANIQVNPKVLEYTLSSVLSLIFSLIGCWGACIINEGRHVALCFVVAEIRAQ